MDNFKPWLGEVSSCSWLVHPKGDSKQISMSLVPTLRLTRGPYACPKTTEENPDSKTSTLWLDPEMKARVSLWGMWNLSRKVCGAKKNFEVEHRMIKLDTDYGLEEELKPIGGENLGDPKVT